MLSRASNAVLQATKGAVVVQVPARGLRNQVSYFIAGPPRTRIPFGEKIAHGLFIACGILAFPLWAMYDLREFRKAKRAAEEE